MTPAPDADADGQYRITMPNLPRAQAKARLLQMLSTHHTGAACGIGAVPLANKVLVNERTLRSLISEARDEGIAIAGTPSTGYYIARTAAELEACCQFLRSQSGNNRSSGGARIASDSLWARRSRALIRPDRWAAFWSRLTASTARKMAL